MSGKKLVVYYSWGGNTKQVATMLQSKTGADLFEIKPETPYTSDYNAVVKQAKQEIKEGFYPQIKALPDIEKYGTVLVGTPNWWSTIAPPVATFLHGCDFTGKTVLPFLTHGGGGAGNIEKDIKAYCTGAFVGKNFSVYGNGGRGLDGELSGWLEQVDK